MPWTCGIRRVVGRLPRERAARERLRLDAAERCERGESNAVIASELRVARRSVERWRRAWRAAGVEGLRSSGPASVPRLDPSQIAALEGELDRGPRSHGWQDQRWTLMRVKAVIRRRFGVTYSIHGVWELPRRAGWSCQQPVRRAVERDEDAVRGWVRETWPSVEAPRRRSTPGSSSRTGRDVDDAAASAYVGATRGHRGGAGVRGSRGRVSMPHRPATSRVNAPVRSTDTACTRAARGNGFVHELRFCLGFGCCW
ncbi:winged helix-turn-helix domain-containing protein [Embleya sp. NBC_00896]|uniref:winged helix-turn-helix domain-containing protein n=1 Tax=Embleya sp. NBC_00896 TaxID=2975961 RepID=UPI00386DF8AB